MRLLRLVVASVILLVGLPLFLATMFTSILWQALCSGWYAGYALRDWVRKPSDRRRQYL